MTMRPSLRPFALTVHFTFSVGWLGAAAAFLALVVTGLTGQDAQVVRDVYVVGSDGDGDVRSRALRRCGRGRRVDTACC